MLSIASRGKNVIFSPKLTIFEPHSSILQLLHSAVNKYLGLQNSTWKIPAADNVDASSLSCRTINHCISIKLSKSRTSRESRRINACHTSNFARHINHGQLFAYSITQKLLIYLLTYSFRCNNDRPSHQLLSSCFSTVTFDIQLWTWTKCVKINQHAKYLA